MRRNDPKIPLTGEKGKEAEHKRGEIKAHFKGQCMTLVSSSLTRKPADYRHNRGVKYDDMSSQVNTVVFRLYLTLGFYESFFFFFTEL